MRRIYPAITPIRTFVGRVCKGELFFFRRFELPDMEFLLASHLVVFFPDGIFGASEYNNGHRVQAFRLMAPNSVIFNPAHEYLRFRVVKMQTQCRVLLLAIEPQALARLGLDDPGHPDENPGPRIGVSDRTLGRAMAGIQQEIESPGTHSAHNIETFLVLALDRLFKHQSDAGTLPVQRYVKGGLTSWRLRVSLQMMEGNARRMPHLSEIAKTVNLHEASFCRAFRQSTGVTPHRYLLSNRVDRAKELMKDPNRSLTEIALDCGFSSSSQFSVAFKRIVGESPGRFRRSLGPARTKAS